MFSSSLIAEINNYLSEMFFWISCWQCVGNEWQPPVQRAHSFNLKSSTKSWHNQICQILLIAPTFLQVGVASGGVCSAGYVCPPGTMYPEQHPCPLGTWSRVMGAQNLSSCWPCPPGRYCNSTGLSRPSGFCDAGKKKKKYSSCRWQFV